MLRALTLAESGMSPEERAGKARAELIADAVEGDIGVRDAVLDQIRTSSESYYRIAKACLNGHLNPDDTPEVIRSAISKVAVVHLSAAIRKDHADRVRHTLTVDDCRKGSESRKNPKTTFTRAEQVRGIVKRGQYPWTDAEESMLLAFSMDPELQKTWNNGQVVFKWEQIHLRLKELFPHLPFGMKRSRHHFHNIKYRHGEGGYGRFIMPDTYISAVARALHALVLEVESRGSITEAQVFTVTKIRELLCSIETQYKYPENLPLDCEKSPHRSVYRRASLAVELPVVGEGTAPMVDTVEAQEISGLVKTFV